MAASHSRVRTTGRFIDSKTGRSSATRSTPNRAGGQPQTHPIYLIDNSVWARLSTDATVVAALKAVVDLTRPDNVLVCPAIVLEVGFSARNGTDHSALTAALAEFPQCPEHPTVDEVMLIQNRLWNGGLVRAAGAVDTLIAAYAITNSATLLHYDSDFGHIARVMPELNHRWIVPRGLIT